MAEKKIVDLPVSQTMSDNDSVFVSQNGSPVWVAFSKLKSLIKTFSGSYNDLSDKPSFKTINGNSIVGSGNISITGGTGTNVTVDSALSATSTNPVQNKVINDELNKKLNKSDYTAYSLPTASATVLGGVKPVAKTTAMTQGVGIDANGGLWTEPGESGGSSVTEGFKIIIDHTLTEPVTTMSFSNVPLNDYTLVYANLYIPAQSSTEGNLCGILIHHNNSNVFTNAMPLSNGNNMYFYSELVRLKNTMRHRGKNAITYSNNAFGWANTAGKDYDLSLGQSLYFCLTSNSDTTKLPIGTHFIATAIK